MDQAHHQNERGCAVWMNHTTRMSEDVQYGSSTSPELARMCSMHQAHHQSEGECAV